MSKPSLTLGPLTVHSQDSELSRMAVLLWGPAGAGKTTYAATAPGKKLWLSMGDNEHVTVQGRKDVQFVKLYEMELDRFFSEAESDNPFGLDTFLAEHTEIETLVFDSATALAFRALQKAIKDQIGKSATFRPSIEAPGISAYGARNGLVLACLTGLLRVTAKHNVHLIVTAHEADPTMRKEGNTELIDYIGIMLGGQLVNNMSWRLSEIWYFDEVDSGQNKGKRRLAVRPTRLRRPMKTRMFINSGPADFVINYTPDKPDKGQQTIASFYDKWCAVKGERISV